MWTGTIMPFADPGRGTASDSADEFACAIIRVICGTGVSERVGRMTYERCLRALLGGSSARLGFRHPGKAEAIDLIWRDRVRLHREFRASADKAAYLGTLPWIGPVTRAALAAELGLNVHEPGRRRAA
jgi:hypothetical protein